MFHKMIGCHWNPRTVFMSWSEAEWAWKRQCSAQTGVLERAFCHAHKVHMHTSQYKTARTRGTHQQLMLHSSDAQRSFLMEPYDNRFECYDTIKKKKTHCVSVRACFISLFWQVKDCCRQVKNKQKKYCKIQALIPHTGMSQSHGWFSQEQHVHGWIFFYFKL